MSFTCKDCEIGFPSAKEFVDHVSSCIPRPKVDVQNAAVLLRALVYSAHRLAEQYPDHRYSKRLLKDADLVYAWLKANNLGIGSHE